MKPSVRIDNFKLEFSLMDALGKIEFLGKISESEDNSSELAGFEINKLMREQTKLEADYARLIKERSTLKGIKNREEHQKVDEEIASVSRSLKENTKKLCRLFKENTNLDNDSLKVREERTDLMKTLGDLLENTKRNTIDKFTDDMNNELDSQNALGDQLKREKELSIRIKNLKSRISDESKEFEDIRKEKKSTIYNLRNEVTKAQTESYAKLRYSTSVSETKIATAKRINKQKLLEIQKQKEEVSELHAREIEVAAKLISYLEEETRLTEKMDKDFIDEIEIKKDQIKEEITSLKINIERNKQIIEKFTKGIEDEKEKQAKEEAKIQGALKSKEDEEKKNLIIDEKMKIIQQQFEEWMRLVGPKNGGKKTGKK
jgi:IQ domain-containing protein G